ncbi:MAG TPA: ferritin-like domain-containing protein [Chloroflexia bacterium]|nr:ferritin-like domain-containing protein [Chloroflexia bacterium]
MAIDKLAYQGLTNVHSRRSFLKKMGVIGGGVMALSVMGEGMMLGVAAVHAADNDLQTVQFAYTLELVAVDAYQTAAKSGLLSPDVVAVGTKFAGQHQQHANALKAAITSMNGAVPEKPAKINYPAFKTQEDILNFALTLESAAVGAYYTATGGFANRDLANAAASIVGVEATHVAVLSSALNKDPIPTAFTTGLPFDQVQSAANSLLSTGGQGGGTATAAAPSAMPSTGMGGARQEDNLTGTGLGIFGVLAAAGAAALALKHKSNGKTEEKAEVKNNDL